MKIAIIIAIILIVVGIVICAVSIFSVGFDFKKLSMQKYVHSTQSISEDFQNILIKTNTANVTFKLSDNGECKIDSSLPEKFKLSATVENGTLNIRISDTRKWYDHIHFLSFGNDVITVYLPKSEFESFGITTDTGDVSLPSGLKMHGLSVTTDTGDISVLSTFADYFGDVHLKTHTGDVKLGSISSQSIRIKTNTGDVDLNTVSARAGIDITSSTGDVKLLSASANGLKIKTDTGDVKRKESVCTDTVDVSTDTGDVEFSGFDASGIKIVTDTGDVRGSLLTPKYFVVKSDTGREIYPSDSFSEQRCEITTDTGDIKITIG